MNVATKPSKNAAPGQYLGYALQPVRLCYHLLTCGKADGVSMEFLDDVAIHGPGKSLLLEQTKSALSHNPISDLSVDLWKSISNWMDLIEEGAVDPENTKFRLYVTPVYSGSRASALSDAKTPQQVSQIAADITNDLQSHKGKLVCKPYLDRFLSASDELRFALVSRLTIVSADIDPVEPIRALLLPTIPTESINVICQAAIGMAKESVDDLIRRKQQPIVGVEAFRTSFHAFIRRNNLPNLLISEAIAPAEDDMQALLKSKPTFIRQLELIGANEDDFLRAIGDYLRTSADKSVWAERGLIFEKSLRDWDDDLVGRHAHIQGEIADIHGDKDKKVQGRVVYRRCSQLQAPLEGRAVPGHFVHGCFNALADECRLGWHPEYDILLRKADE